MSLGAPDFFWVNSPLRALGELALSSSAPTCHPRDAVVFCKPADDSIPSGTNHQTGIVIVCSCP